MRLPRKRERERKRDNCINFFFSFSLLYFFSNKNPKDRCALQIISLFYTEKKRTLSRVLQKPFRVKGTVRSSYDYPLSFRLSPFVKAIRARRKDFIASGLRRLRRGYSWPGDFFLPFDLKSLHLPRKAWNNSDATAYRIYKGSRFSRGNEVRRGSREIFPEILPQRSPSYVTIEFAPDGRRESRNVCRSN